ncbi:MlaD family protein [Methylomonas sp. AM2-LC]|uniref:MlaD family protein n=1 Tax=Methylomonas sp. AM2-LC TaxID=3153301 RepID=UPI00326432A9
MSKQANPLAIGTFLIGALLLFTIAVLVFGGSDFFKNKKRFVIFFDSALNGLNIGAPVKLQGVQIGKVVEISLEMDVATGRIFKPVVIEIEPELLRDFSGHNSSPHNDSQQQQERQHLIDLGLKARLETQSLLTGLLYVDFDFYHDKQINLVNMDYKDLPELPSVPTTADEIKNTAEEVFKKLRQLPLEKMVKDLSETLEETRSLLKSNDLKNSLLALSNSLQESQKLIHTLNAQVGPVLINTNSTLLETRAGIQDIHQQLVPMVQAATISLNTASQALQNSQHTLNAFEELANPDSLLGQTLKEMRDASRAMKDLSESLERQPNEIIYGK